MGEFLKLGAKLLLICAIASGLLAVTYKSTSPQIAKINEEANNNARQIVLTDAKEFKSLDTNKYKTESDVEIMEVFEGLNGSDVVGYTIKVAPKGYSGEIEIMVGITKEGRISGVNIGNMSETPGLGAKAKEEFFYSQYEEKPAVKLEVVKGKVPGETQIEAISGATITSEAVTHGVNEAIKVYESIE